jgi:hypothetical protein
VLYTYVAYCGLSMPSIQGRNGPLGGEYAWTQRHTPESWKERYKKHTDRLARRIKEIFSERTDNDRRGNYEKDRRFNNTRYFLREESEEIEDREDADEAELQMTQRQVQIKADGSVCSRLCIIMLKSLILLTGVPMFEEKKRAIEIRKPHFHVCSFSASDVVSTAFSMETTTIQNKLKSSLVPPKSRVNSVLSRGTSYSLPR